MTDELLVWRLLKFVGIALWTSGLAGALLCRDQRRRMWSVHVLATIGLLVTWTAGYGMTKLTGASLRDGWVGLSIVASLLTVHEACAIAERPRVLPWNVGALVATYLSAIATMVVREPGSLRQVAVFAVPAVLGGIALVVQSKRPKSHDHDLAAVFPATRAWIVTLARLEGLSLLALLALYMPLKYGADIVLDGGQGWFGWAHGMLAILWLQALWSGARRLEWGWRLTGIGFVASVVPFGTFVFERFIPHAPPNAR
jgi:integral membrane protein